MKKILMTVFVACLTATISLACDLKEGSAKEDKTSNNVLTFHCEPSNDYCFKKSCDADGHWVVYLPTGPVKGTPIIDPYPAADPANHDNGDITPAMPGSLNITIE